MFHQHIEQLEYLLQHEESFEKTHAYFMDNFAEHREFAEIGERVSVPYITTMLGELCSQFFKKKAIELHNRTVIKVATLQLLHGFVQVEGHLMVFFYCKRINQGMACLVNMTNRNDLTHYFRITPTTSDGSPVPQTLFKDTFEGTEN